MKLKDAIEIMRPINDLMGGLTVIIGILNTRTGISFPILLINFILGVATYFFVAASGMIINDYYDYPIDRINRPERPIPRGSISLKQAKLLYILTFSIGVILAIIHSLLFNLGIINIFLAIFFGFIGWLYAAWGKKSGFFGNIIVSISFSIGLIYGAVLNASIVPIYIYFFFLTSFFLLLAREVVKGCEDIEGDKKEGVKTLAIKYGTPKALNISIIFQIFAIVFFVLPIFTNIINKLLFTISMIPGLVDVAYATILSIRGKTTKENLKRISLLLKIGAFLGLLAFIFASI
ncbi:MAG: Digeranylgeranylglyceryl phosphate synthase [Promethearchaeota archaeon]|nr:MAG: Digeranylgeranylglyceryl phosphate synthase [Candidatus Lokiarchaeota archaeon]